MGQLRLSVVAALGLVCGCGGGGGKAQSPVAPTPHVSSIAITAPASDFYLTNAYTFAATETLSNGVTQPVTAALWNTDAPEIAQFSEAPRLVITGVGDVTVIAQRNDATASVRLTTYPDFQGAFAGTYRITGCTAEGDYKRNNFCRGYAVGQRSPLTLNLTQTKTALSGTLAFGDVSADPFSATTVSNTVTIATPGRQDQATMEATLNLRQQSRYDIFGSVRVAWRSAKLSGSATIDGELDSGGVIRTDNTTGHP
jgi:hypothetical protein